jgi:hypothetical protein
VNAFHISLSTLLGIVQQLTYIFLSKEMRIPPTITLFTGSIDSNPYVAKRTDHLLQLVSSTTINSVIVFLFFFQYFFGLLINKDKRSDVFLKERPEQYNCKA